MDPTTRFCYRPRLTKKDWKPKLHCRNQWIIWNLIWNADKANFSMVMIFLECWITWFGHGWKELMWFQWFFPNWKHCCLQRISHCWYFFFLFKKIKSTLSYFVLIINSFFNFVHVFWIFFFEFFFVLFLSEFYFFEFNFNSNLISNFFFLFFFFDTDVFNFILSRFS